MALPTVTSRPEKTINNVVSRWNAANLPLIYKITNTKWPTNTDDAAVAITSISNDNGFAKLNHGSSLGLAAKEWVEVTGTTNYNGQHQIRSVTGNNLTIDFPFGVSETGNSQKYYQNYTSIIRVYAGIDPAHTFASQKAIELIGTIEQRPDTDNITYVDVSEYIKNKLNTNYDENLASWTNDINGWTDFYISFAERYDLVTAGVVDDFVSAYTNDENGAINYMHAVHSALQFGNSKGGNMHDYVANDNPYDGVAKWMTDFGRLKIIGSQNWNASIIIDLVLGADLKVWQYDSNGDLITNDNLILLQASFLQDFSIAAQNTSPTDVFFRADGLKMYMSAVFAAGTIYEYDLSVAWDISTSVFLQSFSVNGEDTQPTDVYFRADGLKMYMVGVQNNKVYEYDLGVAWDVTSAVFLQDISIAAQDTGAFGISFKTDGTKMYLIGQQNDLIYEYNLTVAWDITTATLFQSFSVASEDTSPSGLYIRTDGLRVFFVGDQNDSAYAYDLGTAWDISTAVFLDNFDASSKDNSTSGIYISPDQLKMYIIGTQNDKVYEYDLGASITFTTFPITTGNIGRASFLQDFLITAQDTSPTDIFFRADGLKMYMSGSQNDSIYEYDLSTAWDVTSAVYNQLKDVSAQDTNPTDVFFKSDGLKMYVLGTANDKVYEYDLSVAWDVSTAVYLQDFSVLAQDSGPTGISFNDDGLKMYIVGSLNDKVYEYNLGTAWDISTGAFLQDFSITEDTNPAGIYIRPDGLRMYIIGDTNDKIYSYKLTTAWDISTAAFIQDFDISGQDGLPQGIYFKTDQSKMYFVGQTNGKVYEYDLDGLDTYRGLFRLSFDTDELDDEVAYIEMAVDNGSELSERLIIDIE